MTHALLFTQNVDSLAIARKFYGGDVFVAGRWDRLDYARLKRTIVILDAGYPRLGRFPGLRDFEIFGDRIAHILRKMEDWKPRTFRELFIYGYKGRFEWWVAVFGVFVGFVSLLILAMGIWAAVAAQKQYNLALSQASGVQAS
jgi:hypothetical protein